MECYSLVNLDNIATFITCVIYPVPSCASWVFDKLITEPENLVFMFKSNIYLRNV